MIMISGMLLKCFVTQQFTQIATLNQYYIVLCFLYTPILVCDFKHDGIVQESRKRALYKDKHILFSPLQLSCA